LEFNVKIPEATFSGLPVLNNQKFIVKDPYNKRGLSTSPYAFSFGAAKDGKPHSITVDNQSRFDSFDTNTLAWDNKTEEKVLYLTFDCGYKYKDLDTRILNTLSEKNVKATFFCTIAYARTATSEISRMISDGHIVGNHTANHPSDCSKLTREALALDILELHNYVRANYGYNMKYFRFPGGNYSQDNLDLIDSIGYRTVFWSIAHADWDPEDQPGVEVSFSTLTKRLHPGAVILLHSTSPDNVEILGRFIDYCRAEGYEFRSLDQYGHWN
jgi:peptidoglycan-N-acetylmuramic acid deacetylase